MLHWFVLITFSLTLLVTSGGALAQDDPPPADTEPATAASEAEAPVADDADQPITTGQAFLFKLRQGGVTMLVLLIVSIIGVAYAVERFVNLRKSRIVPDGLADQADRLWRQKQYSQVEALGRKDDSTLGRMLAAIAHFRHAGASEASKIAGDIAARDLKRHLKRAYPLAVVATLSPLLGLLGTVIGMIGAFDQIAAMGELANPAAFGGDIGKALITTGVGLSIAVPALGFYHFFKSRVGGFGIELEEQVSELVAEWFLTPPSPDKTESKAKPAAESTDKADPSQAASKPTPEPAHAD